MNPTPHPPASDNHRAGALARAVGRGAPLRSEVPLAASWSVLALLPVRVFLTVGWLRAGVEKLVSESWWRGDDVRSFLVAHRETSLPFVRPVVDHLIAPNGAAAATVVVLIEIAIAISIGCGFGLRFALHAACLLNVVFVMCGAVNPSAFYLVMQLLLLHAIADGAIGGSPTDPSRRSVIGAVVAFVAAAALGPFVRTLDPAEVVADPASMLAFLCVLIGTTTIVRWSAAHPAAITSRRTGMVVPHLVRWMNAGSPSHGRRLVELAEPDRDRHRHSAPAEETA